MRNPFLKGTVPLRRWPLRVSFAFAIVLATSYTVTQNPSTTATANRPKIGLVLEGGGALGLAHIGVIQWLEEHRIPVEYIAGTSMGGLVGGIYATGHSPAEVKAMVRSINWDQVLQGNTPYKDLSYRRKQDAFEYPNVNSVSHAQAVSRCNWRGRTFRGLLPCGDCRGMMQSIPKSKQ